MKEFISFREFCLLKDPTSRSKVKRDLVVGAGASLPSCQGRGWSWGREMVARYDLAKENWERFGDDGPPIGTKVFLLSGGRLRIVKGIYENDSRFFDLENPLDLTRPSIVERSQWWAWMVPADSDFVTSKFPWKRWEDLEK